MLARTACGSSTTSCPATTARPEVGLSTVLRIRNVVVLPAPLGPSSPKISPGLAVERDIAHGGDPAALVVEERLAEIFDLDHAVARLSMVRSETVGQLRRKASIADAIGVPDLDTTPTGRPCSRTARASSGSECDRCTRRTRYAGGGCSPPRECSAGSRRASGGGPCPPRRRRSPRSSGCPCRWRRRTAPSWPILAPCVTQDDWMLGTLSR